MILPDIPRRKPGPRSPDENVMPPRMATIEKNKLRIEFYDTLIFAQAVQCLAENLKLEFFAESDR
ncbi:MAG: hypothetical protein A2W19_07340 [Spirochaetes bacterium RBG_16_49_21]|nr:MAG: hypothetical protein A2W19_11700 [Spirochaetes bacterium RBG_16_49_21]OHD71697.1 MAG: hypothetical protein A2W19_07340 [Spirochaetes bacterium RBG_16_49_21]